jgi:CheY-like chemotaxis protein
MSFAENVPASILVVDDDRLQRMIISRIAKTMGFGVSEVGDLKDIPAAVQS